MPSDTMINGEQCLWFLNNKPNVKFLTVTLPPKYYKYSSITQLEITNNELYKILLTTCDSFICIAEHTQAGNVHYHALISHSNKYGTILTCNKLKKSRLFGFIKVNTEINNKSKCAEYMIKDLKENDKIFSSLPGHKPWCYMTNELWRNLYEY